MEISLTRVYKSGGTNGTLTLNGHFLCFTIELPWRENKRLISCIPEGVYELQPRFSDKHKAHLQVLDVFNRSQILIHGANDAFRELQGCIAPVMQLTGIGTGIQSQRALQKLLSLCHQARDKKEPILLNINSNRYEYLKQIQQTHT
ncbi:MAG: DUF5675 family protein [Gelidibacter sp.]